MKADRFGQLYWEMRRRKLSGEEKVEGERKEEEKAEGKEKRIKQARERRSR